MDFLAAWGWVFLAAFAVIVLFTVNRPSKAIIPLLLAAVALYYFVGFNKDFFNPRELHMESAFAFVAGVLVGGWGWIILAALWCGVFALVHYERGLGAFALLVASAGILFFVTGWNIFTAILYHPFLAIIAFALYTGAGAFWSWFKWNRFVDEALVLRRRAQGAFIQTWRTAFAEDLEAGKPPGSAAQMPQFAPARARRQHDDVRWEGMDHGMAPEALLALKRSILESLNGDKIPDELLKEWYRLGESRKVEVFQNKERLTNWIMFWPWSALSYFFFDLLREFFEAVWNRMVFIYQAVVDRKYAVVDPRLINPAPSANKR